MRLRVLVLGSLLGACSGLVGELPGSDAGIVAELDGGLVSVDAGEGRDAGSVEPGVDAGTDAGAAVPDAGLALVDAGLPDAGRALRPAFLIGGQDMRHLVSFDGRTWQADSFVAPNGEDNAFSGAAIGPGVMVLSGDPGLYRSTDGLTWSLAQARPDRFTFHSSAAAYANGQFVVVSQDTAWRSVDGLTWETKQDTVGSAGHWHGLVWGNGHWLALGDGTRKLSENGLDWHDVVHFTDTTFQGVAFGNGRFVAVGLVGGNGWVATSTDGLTWTPQATIPTMYATGLSAITFARGVFITSTCCTTLQSADGVSWTSHGSNGSGGAMVTAGGLVVSSGWRTEASFFDADAGQFARTLTGDRPSPFEDGGIAPWFTGLGAGEF